MLYLTSCFLALEMDKYKDDLLVLEDIKQKYLE